MSDLRGKSILYFGPRTFGYEASIVSTMQSMGATVTFRSDPPWAATWLKALSRLWPSLLWRAAERSHQRWLREGSPSSVDIVFVIKGEGLSPRFLQALRKRFSGACFVLYLWDSVENVRSIERKFAAFDYRYSFDPIDCSRYPQLKYRPLFFSDEYCPGAAVPGAGVFFIGTLNGDRPRVLLELVRSSGDRFLVDYWLFVRSNIEFRLRWLFDQALRRLDTGKFLRIPMSPAAIKYRMQSSLAVVDIEHPKQAGLTMRTFEVLASGRKLVTTNRSVTAHDFFDPSRICVIDRESPYIPDSFLLSDFRALSPAFFERYSIRGWLLEITGCSRQEFEFSSGQPA